MKSLISEHNVPDVRGKNGGRIDISAYLARIGFVGKAAADLTTPRRRPEGARTHMLFVVDTEQGPHLADVGFGGYLLDAPVKLEQGVPQRSAASAVRVMRDSERSTMQAELPAGWQDMYRFTLEPQVAADYNIANWFTSTHPQSFFRTSRRGFRKRRSTARFRR